MDMSLRKRIVSGPLALLAVALGVIGCMVFADTSSAVEPPEGVACVAADGKISGRGATFQERAQQTIFIPAYREDVCGPTPGKPEDVAGNNMLTYNYKAAQEGSGTGSGAGIKAASCRTDAYAASDIPYTEANLKEMDGAPGATGGCGILFEPPFQPKPKPWPAALDTEAKVMSFPVAGSDVSPVVNLTKKTCEETEPPKSLNFTAKELSRIFGGDAKTWNDAELVTTNAGLAKCSGVITRVVRQDSSGTTNIFKQFLIRGDAARAGATCGFVGEDKWENYFTTNTEWPGFTKKHLLSEEGTCSALVTGVKSGNGELLNKLKETEGGIGYADLNEAEGSGLLLPNVRNGTNTSFQPPASGKAANCTFTVIGLPGATPEEAVGLNTENNWGNNNAEVNGTGNHENVTDEGPKFPICGITFMFVYSGLNSNNGEGKGPISRLTADQRRTLYSYALYVLSLNAQGRLGSSFYAPLPTAWLPVLSQGVREGF